MINFGVINLSDNWNFGHQVMFAQSSYDNSNKDDHTFANVVIRPIYNWSETMKTEFEAGYYTEENQWGMTGQIMKVLNLRSRKHGRQVLASGPDLKSVSMLLTLMISKTTTALVTTNLMNCHLVSKQKHGGNRLGLNQFTTPA